jgi:uncharacterized membrane protein YjgN (DUF898 family)
MAACPKCGEGGVDADRCPHCGVVIPLYRAYLDKVRAGPTAPVAVAAPAAILASTALAVPPVPVPAESILGATSARPDLTALRRLRFHGTGGSLFGMWVVNVFLTLITLGIGAAWARVRTRKYLFSQTSFDGDRFAYHGTAEELVRGYLKAGLVFGVPFYGLTRGPELLGAGPVVTLGAELLAWTLLVACIPVAVVGARRYRLGRTSWRGIRFAFRGPTLEFVKLFLGGGLLTALTLGVYYPTWITRRQAFLVSHSYFGSEPFHFDGGDRELRWPFLMALLLFPVTLGLSWFWFKAARDRHFARHTSFGLARLHSTVTGRDLMLLTLTNGFLLIVTLGVAYPWNVARSLTAAYSWLSVGGPLELEAVVARAQRVSATGEGLAGFFDTGFDLG